MLYIYEDCSKGSKGHPERIAMTEHFCCGNTPTYKTRKTNSDFSQFLCKSGPIQIWVVCDKSKI